MNEPRFDGLTRTLGQDVSRRSALGVLAGGLAFVAWDGASEARKKHRGHKGRSRGGVRSQAKAGQRPISDFVDAQGSTVNFVPPIGDFLAWINVPTSHFASVDYAGLANAYLVSQEYPDLGTKTFGSITERPLKDGRAEVSVVLRTTNALSWAVDFTDPPNTDIANDPLDFGYRPAELLLDAALRPALGSSHFHVKFTILEPGDPSLDLVDAFILGNALDGQELLSMSFRGTAEGALRAPFGVAEGTPGKLTISQTGLFDAGHGPVGDGFPAERVELRVVGGGTQG